MSTLSKQRVRRNEGKKVPQNGGFEIKPGEIMQFSDISESMGFSGKTTKTARTFSLSQNEELQKRVKKHLPENVEFMNTNSVGFKGSLYRRFLEHHGLDKMRDGILNAFYNRQLIHAGKLADKHGVNLPKKLRKTILPKANKVSEYLEATILAFEVPQEIQAHIESERMRLTALYGKNIDFYIRSAAVKGEDGGLEGERSYKNPRLMKARKVIAKLQDGKMGAGQHGSYMDIEFRNQRSKSTLQSVVAAFHQVWASTDSFEAVSDYDRKCDEHGSWFHSGVDMDVIMMPVIHSSKGASALGFSDVCDGITEITFGPKAMGSNLVEGVKEYPMINTFQTVDGIRAEVIGGGYLDPKYNGILKAIAEVTHFIEELEAPAEPFVNGMGKKEKMCVDSEWAFGPLSKGSDKFYLSIVQYRTFRPAQHSRNTTIEKFYEILNQHELDAIKPIATGTSVGEMCAVGEALFIKDERHLMSLGGDVKGKILIVKEAYSKLLGTISPGAAGWVVIPKALKAHAILNGDEMIAMTLGIKLEALKTIKNGEKVSIIMNSLYKGDLSSNFTEYEYDLSKIETEGFKMSVVEGNTSASKRRKMYKYFMLGILEHNALFRLEAAGWNGAVPGLFNWVYFNNLDSTPEGKETKKYIVDCMKSYGMTDPLKAYERRMAAVMAPLAAFFAYFDQNCEIRMHGARRDEELDFLKGVDFPHELNPIISFNGAALYATDWGWVAAQASLRILKKMEQFGVENSSIFVPNITSMEIVEKICNEAISIGLNLPKRGVKVMIENAVSISGKFIDKPYELFNSETLQMETKAPSLIQLRDQLREQCGEYVPFSASHGFNDGGNSWTGADIRHQDMPDRSVMSTSYYMEAVNDFNIKAQKYEILVTNCGLAEPGIMYAMLKSGAKSVGVPVGLKTIRAASLLTKVQQLVADQVEVPVMSLN